MHVIVPEKDWKNYGALFKSDAPDVVGWDILAILEEDVPFTGTLAVPVVHPASGSCGGYVSMEQANLNGTRRANIFLLGKKQDQCLFERDSEICKLKAAVQSIQEAWKTLDKNYALSQASLEREKTRADENQKSYCKSVEANREIRAHCIAAQKHLGEKVWLEAIGLADKQSRGSGISASQ